MEWDYQIKTKSKGSEKGNQRTLKNIGSRQVKMKGKILKKHFVRTGKLLENKLYCRNIIKGINTWVVPLISYCGQFMKWTREELKQMEQSTRNLTSIDKAFHPRDDVEGLFVSRKEVGRGLPSIQDSVDSSIQRFKKYIKKCKGSLITTN